MPLWHIHHPADTYTAHDKQNFARDITAYYTRFGLPEFYVVALFHELPAESFYVGGRPTAAAVRITIDHLARTLEDPELRKHMSQGLDALMAPYTRDRGLHTEFNINEVARDTWMIAGLFPPPKRSAAEQTWARENKPGPY
jgi:phenylpyruvate tautomerase PptA (4-oxalocrotonate tautomerase family)